MESAEARRRDGLSVLAYTRVMNIDGLQPLIAGIWACRGLASAATRAQDCPEMQQACLQPQNPDKSHRIRPVALRNAPPARSHTIKTLSRTRPFWPILASSWQSETRLPCRRSVSTIFFSSRGALFKGRCGGRVLL